MKTQHVALVLGMAAVLPGCSSSTPDTPDEVQPVAHVSKIPQPQPKVTPSSSSSTLSPPAAPPVDSYKNAYGTYPPANSSSGSASSGNSYSSSGTSSRDTSPTYNSNPQGSPSSSGFSGNDTNQQSIDAERRADFNNRIQADQERDRARQEEDRLKQAEIQDRFDNDVRQQQLKGLQNEREDVIKSNRPESDKKLNLDSINDRERRIMRNP